MGSQDKNNVLQRLKRIEGQVRGLQRMVGEEEACVDILTQIAAVRAALAQVGKVVFEKHSRTCIQQALAEGDRGDDALDDLLQSLNRLLK